MAVFFYLAIFLATPAFSGSVAGVWAHVYKQGGKQVLRNGFTEQTFAAQPYIAGTQAGFTWTDLNPSPGVYDWARMDHILDLYGRNGKQVYLEILTANRTGGQPMPRHIVNQLDTIITTSEGAEYPIFWGEQYQTLWGDFLQVFSDRYDGDPRIAFLAVGGIGSRLEFRSPVTAETQAEFELYGYQGDQWYYDNAIEPIMDIYRATLPNTQLVTTSGRSEPFTPDLMAYLALNGMFSLDNGFSVKHGSASSRAASRRRYESGVITGSGEFGPAGRDNKGAEPFRTVEYIYHRAIGDTNLDGVVDDRAFISFLPFAYQFTSVETFAEWEAAMYWAQANLTPTMAGAIPEPETIVSMMIAAVIFAVIYRKRR